MKNPLLKLQNRKCLSIKNSVDEYTTAIKNVIIVKANLECREDHT